MKNIDKTIEELKKNMCNVCGFKLTLLDGYICGLELNQNKEFGKTENVQIIKGENVIQKIPDGCPYKLEKTIIEGE